MTGYSQPYERMHSRPHEAGSHFPVMSTNPVPSFVSPPFPISAPIPVAPSDWGYASASVLAPHRWAPYAAALMPMPVLDTLTGPHSLTPGKRTSPAARKRRVDAEDQPPSKRARVEEGLGEVIAEASVVGRTSADEGGSGKVMGMEIGGGALGSEMSEEIWPLESGLRHIAPKPVPGSVKAAVGLHPLSVVLPQVHDNALQANNYTSITSTHRVDNPVGEPVIEPVPLPSGGPSTSTPADDQEEADEPQHEEDHDEGQHQLGDETSLSKREAAVVIDERVYGRDPLRCLACNNMSFARKYERRRHVVTIHYLKKVPCDWCGIFFYARRDGVTRHKDENCPARDFEDRHTNPMRWFMAWLSGPSGWR